MTHKEHVIKALEEAIPFIDSRGYGGVAEIMHDALDLLKEQEAVDKNTGEWKNGHCSCCGEDVASMLDTWTNVQNFPFCPICGAKQKR